MRRLIKYRIGPMVGIVCVAAFMIASAGSALAQTHNHPVVPPERFWNEQSEELFARLPIQDQGRVKPLSTYALFKLVSLSGRSTLRLEDGGRLSPTRWLMDTLFFPDVASEYKVIRVENPAVMQAVGLPDARERTYFNLHDMHKVQARLYELARSYSEIDEKQRTLQQQQVLNLYGKFAELDRLIHTMQFSIASLEINPDGALAEQFKKTYPEVPMPATFSEWTALLPQMFVLERRQSAEGDQAAAQELNALLGTYESVANMATSLAIFAPQTSAEADPWRSIRDLATDSVGGEGLTHTDFIALSRLESLPGYLGSPGQFTTVLEGLVDGVTEAALVRDEASRFGLELFFYKLKPFRWSLALYLVSFLVVAAGWLMPGSERLNRAAIFSMIPPTLLLILGITIRSILRGRPPVTTLYETTLFIPAIAIVVALIVEWVTRKRIAIAMASMLGVAGLFLANIYELKDGQDTMGRMVAVLNSNFWLSTHVTIVTIGYSAGLLAAALAHIYIFARLFKLSGDKMFFRSIARMVYGVVCFAMITSFLGTVLGGIWANYSWGRFWGWDPKENGALLIVLWNLIILHARKGGYLRDLGVCVAAVFGGMVVTFSWWGVNLLGVGLHSYGFISGIANTLMIVYSIETVVMGIGLMAARVEIGEVVRARTGAKSGKRRSRSQA